MSEKDGQIYICQACLRRQHRQYLLARLPGLRVKTECHYCHKTRKCYLINPTVMHVRPTKPQKEPPAHSLLICSRCQERNSVPVKATSLRWGKCNHCQRMRDCREIDMDAVIPRAIQAIESSSLSRTMPASLYTKYCSHCKKPVVPRQTKGGIITEVCPHCGHEIKPRFFGR